LGKLGWNIGDVNSLGGTASAIGAMVLSLALGRLAAGRRRRGLLSGQLLVLLGMLCFMFSTPAQRALPIAGYFLLGAVPTLRELSNAQLAGQAAAQLRGTALGLNETIYSLARSLAALLAGALFAVNMRAPFLVSIALIPIGMLLVARLRPISARKDFAERASPSAVILETVDDE
jgi:predicted MFS family arabinose efflux permease